MSENKATSTSTGAVTAATSASPRTAPSAPSAPTAKIAPEKSTQKLSTDSKPIQPLQYVWFAGHAFTVVGTFIEIIAYALFQGHSFWSNVIYRLTFAVIVATYFISIQQKLKGQIPTFFSLLPVESFQYGALATLWLFTTGRLLKLIPYFVYSTLQAGHFASTKIIPGTEHAQKIDSLVTANAKKLEKFVSWNNIFLALRLILDMICLKRGSFLSFLIYGFFIRIRFEYSPATAETLRDLEVYTDKALTNPKVPAKVQDIWKKVKWNIDHYQKHQLKSEKKPVAVKTDAEKSSTTARARQPSESNLFLDDKK